jgi:cell division protein FtsW (lipid II flippase)
MSGWTVTFTDKMTGKTSTALLPDEARRALLILALRWRKSSGDAAASTLWLTLIAMLNAAGADGWWVYALAFASVCGVVAFTITTRDHLEARRAVRGLTTTNPKGTR